MLDLKKIRAITLDLDDTLWPVWPAIERAEKALHDWLTQHAPRTAALLTAPEVRHEIREESTRLHVDTPHNLSGIRREYIRLALKRTGHDPQLAEPAFEVFFDGRHGVTLFDDALETLEFLSERYPLVALTNGNADVARVGLGAYFKTSISAQVFGVGKPDPRIFHAAAAAVNTLPEHVLHIGDDASLDVLGALASGMQTVWVNREDHLWTHDEHPQETITTLTELIGLFR